MGPGSLRTTTICPRTGYSLSSRTPAMVLDARPVQFTTRSAFWPVWWRSAAEVMFLRLPRLNTTPFFWHWPTSQDKYIVVLMHTEVNCEALLISGSSWSEVKFLN